MITANHPLILWVIFKSMCYPMAKAQSTIGGGLSSFGQAIMKLTWRSRTFMCICAKFSGSAKVFHETG